jgi:hypothetical protein
MTHYEYPYVTKAEGRQNTLYIFSKSALFRVIILSRSILQMESFKKKSKYEAYIGI